MAVGGVQLTGIWDIPGGTLWKIASGQLWIVGGAISTSRTVCMRGTLLWVIQIDWCDQEYSRA